MGQGELLVECMYFLIKFHFLLTILFYLFLLFKKSSTKLASIMFSSIIMNIIILFALCM